VANYDVSIRLAVAGAKELDRVNKRTDQLRKSIDHINKKAQAGTAGTPVVKNFKNLSRAVTDARDALDEAAVGTKEFNHAVKNLVQVENKYNRQLKQREQRLKAQRLAIKEGISFSKAEIIVKRQQRIAEEQLAAAKEKNAKADARRRFMQGPGSAISSAAIGGAFPLLFGQTGAAAVGGGIGGAAGGLIGGQFGFALSILGTAIGSTIEQTDKLNASIASLDFSFKQAGDSSGFTKGKLNELKTTLGLTKDEALAVAGAFARFGETGSSAAFIFGKNPNTFKNLAAIVNTKSALAAILDTSNNLTIQQQIQLLQQGKISSFAEFQAKVNETIIEQNFKRMMQEAAQIKNTERIRFLFGEIARAVYFISTIFAGGLDLKDLMPELFLTAAERAEGRVAKLREEFEKFKTDLPVLQDLMKDFNLEMEGMAYSIPGALDQVSAELRKLMSVGYMVTTTADTIGSAFGESFKGIVKGSMTAQEALRNLFMRTADAFLDMAAQLIAKQIQMKILGIGLNFFGGGIGGSGGGQFIDSNAVPLVDPLTGIGTAANGGPIPGRRPTLVGERGPELFTPGVSGYVTPNHELGGSTTNIVVNVDASGSSVEGDEEQSRELGRIISVAIQSELIKQKRPGGMLA
tara:strand:- start:366 stop:2267 length:1902 start_codon:yes stop_codon:yes gene_type:complete